MSGETPGTDLVLFTPEGEDNVIDMHNAVVQQNLKLIEQLAAFNKAPNQLLLHDLALETLVDMIFDEDGKKQFQLGVDLRLNKSLKGEVEKLSNQLIVPGTNGA